MFILDAHLDLAMNAVEWNRDLTKSVQQIRKSESGMSDKPDRQNNTVSLDAMRKGNIGICVATQIGPGVYAHGTDSVGGIGPKGKELLKKIEELNLVLDTTHLCDISFWETLGIYNGPLWASHNNCRKFVDHNRQYSDEQIIELISRDAVIGESTPEKMGVTLNQMIDNIDHICQLSGNSSHVGIGSDLDGAFGKEQTPYDLDTIADLQKVPLMLLKRGYSDIDIEKIMSLNFINFLKRVWN